MVVCVLVFRIEGERVSPFAVDQADRWGVCLGEWFALEAKQYYSAKK